MINPRTKGKKGEDEACEWISKNLYESKRTLRRNYNQVYIGADIVSHPFIFEVKRSETLALDKWWIQINKVYKRLLEHKKPTIRVVMFRQNHRQWEFLISSETIGCTAGYIRITDARFKEWASKYIVR